MGHPAMRKRKKKSTSFMYPAKNKLFNALSLNVKLQIKFVNHPEGTENRSLTIL